MRRNSRRSRRGRVIASIMVLIGVAAAAGWMFIGKGYLQMRQAQAKSASAALAASVNAAAMAAPVVIAVEEEEDSHPPVPTLDELAELDQPLKPRTSGSEEPAVLASITEISTSEPSEPEPPVVPTVDVAIETPAADTAAIESAVDPAPAEASVAESQPASSDDAETAAPPRGGLKPVAPASGGDAKGAQQKPTTQKATVEKPQPESQPAAGNAKLGAALKLLANGKVIEARHELNALLRQELGQNDAAEVRQQLAKIADDSIFSRQCLAGDPVAEQYTVKSGDRLVNICRDYKVPADVLMYVNGIKDATKLRVEQKLKILRGPFHVKISKSQFRMDIYLQDLYVRSYRVGLGGDQGTPEGVWKVKERLENPTYYPPATSDKKHIIAPDDPQNPLGDHWIGLEGISGDAVGHTGYGIHGTIEPDSIGKAVSLGCVRMLNEDVAFVYKLLQPGESTVTVQP